MNHEVHEPKARDPLQELLRFHRNIRAAVAAFETLAAMAKEGEIDALRASALYDFFTGPMRWHDADERDSLLRRLEPDAPPEIAEAIQASRIEHDAIEGLVKSVLEHLHDVSALAAHPDPGLLGDAAHTLRKLIDGHLEREESAVYPYARRILTEVDFDEMRTEMVSRRLKRMAGTRDATTHGHA